MPVRCALPCAQRSIHHPDRLPGFFHSGIPVVSPPDASDEELYQTRHTMLAMLSDRPDLHTTMAENGFHVAIYGDRFETGSVITDVPEFRDLGLSQDMWGAALVMTEPS